MSNKKRTVPFATSIREESLLFELCSKIGMTNSDAYRRGVLWSAEALIVTGNLPDNLISDYNALREDDKDYLMASHIAHLQHRTVATQFVNSPRAELPPQTPGKFASIKPAFSKEEMAEFSRISASANHYEVASLIPRIRNLYETRTGNPAPYWSPADELTVLNELIDIKAV